MVTTHQIGELMPVGNIRIDHGLLNRERCRFIRDTGSEEQQLDLEPGALDVENCLDLPSFRLRVFPCFPEMCVDAIADPFSNVENAARTRIPKRLYVEGKVRRNFVRDFNEPTHHSSIERRCRLSTMYPERLRIATAEGA